MNTESRIINIPTEGSVVYSFSEKLYDGTVIDRPNRFLVNVRTESGPLKCHIHDPGRLEELIFPGNRVKFRPTSGIKTSHSVTAAFDSGEWVLTDTRIHSEIASKFLPADMEKEVRMGNHRMDFRHGDILIEVKGCTMLVNGVATFPDAPTKRGKEHLQILRKQVQSGRRAMLIVLVFRKSAEGFKPNELTDPDFASEFRDAMKEGVEYFIPKFSFENGSVVYSGEIDPVAGYLH